MDQQNETIENVNDNLVPAAEASSGTVTGDNAGDNAGAYYGDYSQDIYQYLLQHDIPGALDDINDSVSSLHGTVSNILIALVFFIFLFFSFKFIRLKGLDL